MTPAGIDTLRESAPGIVFLSRYFYPDHSATSQMLSGLAFFWPMPGMGCAWPRAVGAIWLISNRIDN